MTDPRLHRIRGELKKLGFKSWVSKEPDPEHFGNWVLMASGNNVALRIFRDRDLVNLDLMPAEMHKLGAPEPEWYTWDVVATALGIPFKPEVDALMSFLEYWQPVAGAFAWPNWKRTHVELARAERAKRRRFTEAR